MHTLNLDFETFSEVDLSKVGLYNYATHPSTEVLMCAWSVDNGPIKHWDATVSKMIPAELAEALVNPDIKKRAFNAMFEFMISKFVLKLDVQIEEFYCTMIHAWHLSFSGTLEMVAKQLGLPENKQKMKEGKQLINRFCSPAPRNHKAFRYDRHSNPEEWARFIQYNIQDVVAEVEIITLIQHYEIPEMERDLWLLDYEINMRGVPVDRNMINEAIEAAAREKHLLAERIHELTGVANPNSNPQLLTWLRDQGLDITNMQADTLKKLEQQLEERDGRWDLVPDEQKVLEVIILKRQLAKTSTSKFDAMARAICDDDRLRFMFAFGAAQRTQRWGGRIVQLHNLPRGSLKDPRIAAEMLVLGGHEALAQLYAPVMNALSSAIRCAIKAPESEELAVCDLASIESRLLGYVSGCTAINNIFASGKDVYIAFAVEIYGKLYEEVTKAERNFAKPGALGCGYQLGWEGLIAYAEGYGLKLTEEEAKHVVNTFRNSYPEVVGMWHWLVNACIDVTQNGTVWTGYTVTIYRDKNFMFIQLPSGRKIAYYQPLVVMRPPPWEIKKQRAAAKEGQVYIPEERPVMSYMGMDQYTHSWKRITTHGGKITENIIQAMARDVLAVWMTRCSSGLDIVLHVHDELGASVPVAEKEDALEFMKDESRRPISWAPTLLLDAGGFTTKRYYKD